MNDQGAPSAAGWFPDPSGEFQLRHWDGLRRALHVSSDGVVATYPHSPDSSPVTADDAGGDASNSLPLRGKLAVRSRAFSRAVEPHVNRGQRVAMRSRPWPFAPLAGALVALPAAVSKARG
jgi:hypothetical protein